MYLQQHQQHHHHHPPNCQHQQQMDDYNCNDGQFTSYNNNNIIPRQINNRVHHPSHHAYNDTGYYGTYPHHTHLTHPVLLTTDSELSRLSSSSSSLHWTKAPSGHDFPPPPPPSSSTPGSLVFYGGQDVGGGGGGGQDWTGAAAQDHDFLQCKDPGVLVACHQLSSPDDHLTHGGGGPAGGLRRTLASVADGCGAASTGGGGGGGGGGCPGDVSGGSTSTFLSHQQQSLRSASSLTTNRHSLGTSPSARNLTTLQPGYAPHHHHHHQQQLRSLCGSAGAGLSLSARSPTGHSDLSTAILGRRSEDQLPRGALGSAGGGGGGRGEGQGAAVGRSANHNQVPFDWMKKQIYPITPTSGKTRTKDKYRIVYSEHQKVELEKEFLYNPYITIQRKAELATIIGLSDRQVKIWFQNRRAKERKQKKKRPQTTTTTAAAAAKAANHVTTNALEPGVETAATGGARSLYHHPHHLPVDHHNNHHHQQQQQQLGRHGGGGRLVAVGGSGDVKMEGGCRVSGLAESVEDGARSNEVKSESVTNL